MKEIILEIKNLNVIYETDSDNVSAVNGLNLTIHKGEICGLVGETGAGKTTTALSIMKLLPDRIGKVVSGEILLNGKNIVKTTEKEMQLIRSDVVSMIFQDPMSSLNPLISIGDQISEVFEIHRPSMEKTSRDHLVDTMLDLIGLSPERKNELPHQFSGGMKQRIVIAMALACEPMLLLADEPTTALDVTIQAQVLEMMKNLQSKFNTAIMLITHDLGVVAQTCDHVGVMYAGEIIEYGSVVDIFSSNHHHHPYTTGLFQSIPDMNKKSKWLQPIEGLMPDPTNLPEGCKFHDRCPKVMEVCKNVVPKESWFDGHLLRCHLFDTNV